MAVEACQRVSVVARPPAQVLGDELCLEIVPAPHLQRALPLLIDYAHKPLGRFYGADDRAAAQWLLTEASRQSDIFVHAAHRQALAGIASLARLPWESEIFGLPMSSIPLIAASGCDSGASETCRALLRSLCTTARHEGLQHLSCRVPAGDLPLIQALEQSGFLLADSTLEYLWRPRVRSGESPGERWRIRESRDQDADALGELAREAFLERTATRFRNDPYLSREDVGELYAQWARRSCRREFADATMVAIDGGEPVGFLTCKLEHELSAHLGRTVGTIGIGVVRPEHEGQGLLTALVHAVLDWCAEQNVRLVRSRIMIQHVTSSWTALRTGARQIAAWHTFHKWLGPNRGAGDDNRC